MHTVIDVITVGGVPQGGAQNRWPAKPYGGFLKIPHLSFFFFFYGAFAWLPNLSSRTKEDA